MPRPCHRGMYPCSKSCRDMVEPRSRGFCLFICVYLCSSVVAFKFLRVDNLFSRYDFDTLLLPVINHAVAAFGVDGLCGVQDELDGCCVAV